MSQQMFWKTGRLYVVTGFNSAELASKTVVAEKLRVHWQSELDLARLLMRAGYQLIQK
ncbi:MAG: hypothetical protein H7Y22_14450 [Gemmatimonadaceae bacterium]|nr:hypothetical protein [Gloeobacterales cyanobacterium ES-bin-141]